MKRALKLILSLGLVSSLFSCEDVIDLDLDKSTEAQFVVDAFLDNKVDTQEIRLSYSTDVFEDGDPAIINDASVVVSDNTGKTYTFTYNTSTDSYLWIPSSATDSLATIGNDYTLTVNHNGTIYTASESCNRITPFDSIVVQYGTDPFSFGDEEKGYFVFPFATDLPGLGDRTWVKVAVNNTPYSSFDQVGANVNADGSLDETGAADGRQWIPPISFNTNPGVGYYNLGDTVRIEFYSLNQSAYTFISEANTQAFNGGLFSVPPGNLSYNISKTGEGREGIGIFNVGAIAFKEFIIPDAERTVFSY